MNRDEPELQALEAELHALVPNAPPQGLADRLGAALVDDGSEEAGGAPFPTPGAAASAVPFEPTTGGAGPRQGRGHTTPSPATATRWVVPAAAAAVLALAVGSVFFPRPATSPVNPGSEETAGHPAAAASSGIPAPPNPVAPAGATAPSDEPLAPLLKPVKADHYLAGARDDGIILIDDGQPARQLRYRFVDTLTWKNPEDGADYRIAFPREEIIHLPVQPD